MQYWSQTLQGRAQCTCALTSFYWRRAQNRKVESARDGWQAGDTSWPAYRLIVAAQVPRSAVISPSEVLVDVSTPHRLLTLLILTWETRPRNDSTRGLSGKIRVAVQNFQLVVVLGRRQEHTDT